MTSRSVKEISASADMTHEQLVKAIAGAAKATGWKVAGFRCVRVQRRNGQVYYETPVREDGKGWPDLVMLHKATGRRIAAEVKVKKDTLKPEQVEWLELMDTCGFESYEWREIDWNNNSILEVLNANSDIR